jgi:Zn-dependent peptidase ImmA (M78 family)
VPGGHDPVVNEQRLADLVELCTSQGVRIEWVDLGAHRHGQYRRRLRLIELNPHLVLRQVVPVLAHEYAHFVYDDGCSTAAHERRAWEHAARMLITPAEYARAERLVGPHPNAIAAELDLTAVLVRAWRRQHHAGGLVRRVDCAS